MEPSKIRVTRLSDGATVEIVGRIEARVPYLPTNEHGNVIDYGPQFGEDDDAS